VGEQPDVVGAPAVARPRAPVLPLGERMRQVGWVLTVVGVLVLGGVTADRLLASSVEPPVRVSPDVRVSPRSGWRTASRAAGAVLLTRGSGSLRVATDEAGAGGAVRPAAAVARDYVERELEPQARGGVRVAPADPVELTSGLVAEGVTYEGEFGGDLGGGERAALVQGEVRAVTEPGGTVVVFDSWAQPEVYAYTADDVAAMTETAEVR
jgi:hypothetical protein